MDLNPPTMGSSSELEGLAECSGCRWQARTREQNANIASSAAQSSTHSRETVRNQTTSTRDKLSMPVKEILKDELEGTAKHPQAGGVSTRKGEAGVLGVAVHPPEEGGTHNSQPQIFRSACENF